MSNSARVRYTNGTVGWHKPVPRETTTASTSLPSESPTTEKDTLMTSYLSMMSCHTNRIGTPKK